MKTFVLSLARDGKKRALFRERFYRTTLPFVFFDGVDGKALCSESSFSNQLLYQSLEESCLTPGEVGCALGHYAIYREIVAKDIPYALVMEDDAYVDESDISDFLAFLDAYAADPSKNSVVLLTADVQYCHIVRSKLSGVYGGYKSGNGTFGYLIDNEAARRLMKVILPVRYEADFWKGFQYSAGISIMVSQKGYVRNGDLSYENSCIADDRNKLKAARSIKQAVLFKEECKTLKYKWRNPLIKLASCLGTIKSTI